MEENPLEKNKNTRREFLKGARDVLGIGALAFGAKNLVDAGKEGKPVSEKIQEAEITKKIPIGGNMRPTFNSTAPGVSLGEGITLQPAPEEYRISLKIPNQNTEQEIEITKEEFNSYQIGQKIKVRYTEHSDTNTIDLISIEK